MIHQALRMVPPDMPVPMARELAQPIWTGMMKKHPKSPTASL
jgi:hypothetical protein